MTNQITTRFDSHFLHFPNDPDLTEETNVESKKNDTGHLVPALGNSWGHICSIRVFLTRMPSGTFRRAHLMKHPGQPPNSGTYQITVSLD